MFILNSKRFQIQFVLVYLVAAVLDVFEAKYMTRILGGSECLLGDFPSQVSLAKNEVHSCGGSLITPKVILTAAHCFRDGALPSEWTAMAGDISDIFEESSTRQVQKVVDILLHPKFKTIGDSFSYDIAIVHVAKPFLLSKFVSPINITGETKKVSVGSSCTIVGWGVNFHVEENDTSAYDTSHKLLATKIEVLPDTICNEKFKWFYDAKEMICAGDMQGVKDACQGDSGGPLICNGVLSGITSFGSGCGIKGTPGVYVNVVEMKEWILSTVFEKNKKIEARSDGLTLMAFQRVIILYILSILASVNNCVHRFI